MRKKYKVQMIESVFDRGKGTIRLKPVKYK